MANRRLPIDSGDSQPTYVPARSGARFNRDALLQRRGEIPDAPSPVKEILDNSPYPCEVIAVNDGSRGHVIDLLVDWCNRDSRIKVLNLSRNFGHQYASTAGIDYASGEAIVLIDADLQDPLEVIHEMVQQYRNGYDVVCGQRITRAGEGNFKRLTAWLFYRFMRFFF